MLRKSHNLKPILLRFWLTFWPHGLKPNLIWESWALVSNSLTHYWDSTPWPPPPPGKAEHLLEEPKSSVMVTVSPSLLFLKIPIFVFVGFQMTATCLQSCRVAASATWKSAQTIPLLNVLPSSRGSEIHLDSKTPKFWVPFLESMKKYLIKSTPVLSPLFFLINKIWWNAIVNSAMLVTLLEK